MVSLKCKFMTSLCRSEQPAQRSVNAIRASYFLTSRSLWHIDYYLGHRLRPVFILSAIRNRENLCPHICVLQCHPGLCPLCKAFVPPWLCPCGKKIITSRCSDQKSVLTCGQCCEKLLER
ncbi:NF-X1-type zinc finger protein NFXL1 [Camellia lanceoleosa]|uniref:NF-X1-type zinc finger protein NFXL1 n=1 Tax=Camellia lanceoleosa TaxID=1840588 RepID=A0ACC0I3T6_9ERIC|nr:NF-X1-type zinc finger protein NFXL1 [Camellia lanceoleosa]